MTTVNQLKEPAAADDEIDMAQSWLEQDTPTGFQRQFNVSDSINCLHVPQCALTPAIEISLCV